MNATDFVKLFTSIYNGTQEGIEDGLSQLKDNGASQIDSVKVLIEALDISLREADGIVLNSIAWSNQKKITQNIRSAFDEYFIEEKPPDDITLNE